MGFNFNAIWETLLLLSILVVVHEFGHFITARLFGVTVYEFSVGFGPLITQIKRKGIQYSFRWLPLGGFVKIAGLDIALEGDPETDPPAGEEKVSYFHEISFWKKVVVIAAGPIFNVILGVILSFCLAAFVGLPSGMKESPTVLLASPGTPAFTAGIRPGDKIVSINRHQVRKWTEIPDLVQKFGSKPLSIAILRNHKQLTKEIIPQYSPAYKRYLIGIEGVTTLERIGLGKAAQFAVLQPWYFGQQTVALLQQIGKKEAKGAFMGPIGMVTVMEQIFRLPAIYIIYKILELAIGINMCLFIFNMLPIPLPMLDGGWIVIMTLEKLLRREFTANQKAAAQMIGIVGVIVLGVFIAYSDTLMTIKRLFGG